jgi:RNA polymerase sigma-70 factor (ECF subfamily)
MLRRPDSAAPAGPGELDLLHAVRSGDKAAFGALVDRYIARASALAFRIVRDRADAEDVVQDAFLAALRRIDSFDLTRPFWPWFSRILVNRAIDVLDTRGRQATSPLDESLPSHGHGPGHALEVREMREHVERAIATLPPRRRVIVEMFELDDLSVAEIAEHLTMTPTTVRWHLHMARKTLRVALNIFRTTAS